MIEDTKASFLALGSIHARLSEQVRMLTIIDTKASMEVLLYELWDELSKLDRNGCMPMLGTYPPGPLTKVVRLPTGPTLTCEQTADKPLAIKIESAHVTASKCSIAREREILLGANNNGT